jgi:hypothetical protein
MISNSVVSVKLFKIVFLRLNKDYYFICDNFNWLENLDDYSVVLIIGDGEKAYLNKRYQSQFF